MFPMIGQISLFAFKYAPAQWMACDGSVIPISENETLFQLLGSKFGGDGENTFGIPNLKSAAPANLQFCISLGGQYQPKYHEGTIGETMLAAFALQATNLMPANGQLLPKNRYPVLDSYMGTRFGGDAQNLALPNLQNQSAGGCQYVIAVQGDPPGNLNPSARQPFVGEIFLLPYQQPNQSLMLCDGAQLPINQNAALYNLIGTTFGGGGTTFALPDLTKTVPKGYSYYISTKGVFPSRG